MKPPFGRWRGVQLQLRTGRPASPAATKTERSPAQPATATPKPSENFAKLLAIDQQRRRWALLGKHADLIAGMNLPPEKLSKFKDLLIARDQAENDARDLAKKAGLDNDETDEAVTQATAEFYPGLRALLSDAEGQRYAELDMANRMGDLMNRIGFTGIFVDAGIPLTADQSTALTRLAGKLQYDQTTNASEVPADQQEHANEDRLAQYQAGMLSQASQVLSPDQLAVLQKYFALDNQVGALLKAEMDARHSH